MHYRKDLSHLGQDHIFERQRLRAPLMDLWWRLADARPGMRVLDVGCGPGFFTLDLARRLGPEGSVLAVDVNPDAIASLEARRGPEHANVRALVLDVETHNPPERGFDLMLLTDVLHHADGPEAILRRLRGFGARLLIAEFDPDGPGEMGPPQSERIPRERLEATLRAAGWSVTRAEAQPFEHYALVAE